MAKYLNNNLFATLLLATVVLVKSLPTSVLVDTKQQPLSVSNKEGQTSNAESAEKAPVKLSNSETKPKSAPQKRGVNHDLSNDILVNNNVPNGVWDDDATVLYPDLQEFEDYQPYQSSPYRQKPYDNLQTILNSNNIYDEPIAMPIKYPYSRYFDDRRKRAVSKSALRLKREPSKLNTADMLALLALIEAGERSRYNDDNTDINSLEYQKPLYSPYSAGELQDDNAGEWWNEWVEPSVQYYGSPYGHIEQAPRERHQKVYPAKRFMVSKRKRSVSPREMHFAKSDQFFANSPKANYATGFDSRYSSL